MLAGTERSGTWVAPVVEALQLKTGYATIKGFEVMHALRKGQAGAF